MKYDSSIFPVRHDRYGVPDAPRTPFRVAGKRRELLELPPLTLRGFGTNLPVAGGGYFRLFPLWVMERGLRQMTDLPQSASVLYFHPWEFDPDQPRLPLKRLSKFRTYVGIRRSRERLGRLLARHQFGRMCDLADHFATHWDALPSFSLS
jgi:polysaccharide deacetylase family protein (PEP-CTERM system associated)